MNRTATLAIAATVAFTPTPLLAQDAPAAEAPVETVTTVEPVAAEPPAPAETTAAPAEPAAEAEARPAAPVAKPRAKVQAKASAPVAKPAPARADPAPLEAQPVTSPLSGPIAEPIAEPTAETVEPLLAVPSDDLERAAFAGILALLALGGAVTAVSRRRRAHAAPDRPAVPETAHSAPPASMPISREPIRHAPSAFAWGRTPAAVAPVAHARGSWVERARRGPSPDNPSLSLKKRLKRAAFYEQRERAVAAGRATPIVAGAGLPERATENFRQSWTAQPAYVRALQTA